MPRRSPQAIRHRFPVSNVWNPQTILPAPYLWYTMPKRLLIVEQCFRMYGLYSLN